MISGGSQPRAVRVVLAGRAGVARAAAPVSHVRYDPQIYPPVMYTVFRSDENIPTVSGMNIKQRLQLQAIGRDIADVWTAFKQGEL